MTRPTEGGLAALAASVALAWAGCDQVTEWISGAGDGTGGAAVGSGEGSGAGAASALSESEPNDGPEQAAPLTAGRRYSGSLAGGDRDCYTVPASDGAVGVSVRAEGSATATVSRARDGWEWDVAIGAGENRIGVWRRDAATSFCLEEGSGSYEIDVVAGSAGPCGPVSDSPGAAPTRLRALGGVATGCVGSADDVDRYLLAWGALTGVDAFRVEVSGVPTVSLSLVVRDADGVALAEGHGGPGQGVVIPDLRLPAAPGDLSVEVGSLSGSSVEAGYSLRAERTPPAAGVRAAEPNGSVETASSATDAQVVEGYFPTPEDVDFVRLESTSPVSARVVLAPAPGMDATLERVGAGGAPGSRHDLGGVGESETLCAVRIAPGAPVILRLQARMTDGADTSLPYRLQVEPFDTPTYESEPNDGSPLGPELRVGLSGSATGMVIALDLPEERGGSGESTPVRWARVGQVSPEVFGHSFPLGDVDRFAVVVGRDLTADVTFRTVTFRLEPGGMADYRIEVADDSGVGLGVADARGLGEAETIALDLPGGAYEARVTLVSGDGCGAPYRLSVSDAFAVSVVQSGAQGTEGAVDAGGAPDEADTGPDETGPSGEPEGSSEGAHSAPGEPVRLVPEPPRVLPPSDRRGLPQRAPRELPTTMGPSGLPQRSE